MAIIKSGRELDVYKLSYKVAMEIYYLTKSFPSYEKFELAGQIRRSSRSVPANIIEDRGILI